MRVGVPREIAGGEKRVALVPDTVAKLEGFSVSVEKGAGVAAGHPDEEYAAAGAELVADAWKDVEAVAKVAPPTEAELEKLEKGQILVSFLQPLTEKARVEALREKGVLGFAMESIPRTTRAQAMTRSPHRPPLPDTRAC